MKPFAYISKSLLHALGVVLYIGGVALFLTNAEKMFGTGKEFFAPILMLLLLVISASITGLLVLGRPIHLYVQGEKKTAFTFLFATLGWLVAFAVLLVILIAVR
ncbi:MAG: hypothetical protein AAB495_00485 [Patescibacteria group bacterium]